MDQNPGSALKNIFISYRERDTAGETGRLADTLKQYFSEDQIFMDIDKLEPGVDFTEVISKSLESCDVMLAVIGPDWQGINPATNASRIKDPNDWVALEIATALKRNIRVVPILVNGAKLPATEDLPEGLQPLLRRQSYEVSNKRWGYDTQQLAGFLERSMGIIPKNKVAAAPVTNTPPPTPPAPTVKKKNTGLIVGGLVLVVICGILYFIFGRNNTDNNNEREKAVMTADSITNSVADIKDSDGDGVPDTRDRELNTSRACFPVDEFGVGKCPPKSDEPPVSKAPEVKDSDGDGVADNMDKEPDTKKECFPVDNDGVGKCPPADEGGIKSNKGAVVFRPGVVLHLADTDEDGVPDVRDKQPNTPKTCRPVDKDGVGQCPAILKNAIRQTIKR